MKYKEIMNDWLSICKMNSVNNEMAARLYFHSMFSAYVKKKIIRFGIKGKDLRIHPAWFQESRTGKDQLNIIVQDVGRKCGLAVETMTDVSGDAAFIGTYDSEADKYNKKHGLSEDNQIIERGTKTYLYQDPIIKGMLADYDIIIVSESKLLFQVKSEKLLTNLQPALDYPGKVFKKMKNKEPIKYNCDPVLILTSIPFKQMAQAIIDQGFYQRLVLFIRRLDIATIMDMRTKARKLHYVSKDNYKRKVNKLVKQITAINREEEEIELDRSCLDLLDELQNKLKDQIMKYVQGQKMISMMSFTQTAEDIIVKFSAHIAIIEGRNRILTKDIKQS